MTSDVLNAKVISKKLLHENLMILKVGFLERPLPAFKPGQFGTLGLLEDHPPKDRKPRLIRRSYSIASSTTTIDFAEYFITKVQKGLFTTKLFDLNKGELLWMAPKMTGFFNLDPIPKEADMVWMATGTGVAPFVSMLRSSVLQQREGRKIALLHGVRYVSDLGYQNELQDLSHRHKNFLYLPIVSRPDDIWRGPIGRLQLLWENIGEKWGEIPSPTKTHVMLCGNPYMIQDMLKLLEKQGFSVHSRRKPGNIHFEKYWTN